MNDAMDVEISVMKADGAKCSRCWFYRKEVGTHEIFKDLCNRCFLVIEGLYRAGSLGEFMVDNQLTKEDLDKAFFYLKPNDQSKRGTS